MTPDPTQGDDVTDSQTVPDLTPPEPLDPPPVQTTGLRELDDAVAMVLAGFVGQLNDALDEVFQGLSYAYPGLYADPDAPTQTTVEWRVQETTGHYRWLTPAASVYAHRQGLRVERRTVTNTEWEVEPNPNRRKPRPIPAHPKVHDDLPTNRDRQVVGDPTDPNGNAYEGEPSTGDFRYLDEPVRGPQTNGQARP